MGTMATLGTGTILQTCWIVSVPMSPVAFSWGALYLNFFFDGAAAFFVFFAAAAGAVVVAAGFGSGNDWG